MFSCICPHVGEELWQQLGHDNTIAYESWPTYDEEATRDDEFEVAVQINGRIKDRLMLPADIDSVSAIAAAKASEKIMSELEGKTVVKEIYVKGKLINIVAK